MSVNILESNNSIISIISKDDLYNYKYDSKILSEILSSLPISILAKKYKML